jgi:hypothetical protein
MNLRPIILHCACTAQAATMQSVQALSSDELSGKLSLRVNDAKHRVAHNESAELSLRSKELPLLRLPRTDRSSH